MSSRTSQSRFAVLLGKLMLGALIVFRGAAAEPIQFDNGLVHPTRILVKTKPGHAPAPVANQVQQRKTKALAPRWLLLEEPPGVQAAQPNAKVADRLRARMAALRGSGDYEYVEPDFLIQTDALPNDDAFTDGRLWGLRNTGQDGGVAGIDVNAVNAWALTTGSTNVIVGIIDTGVRYTHQDLAPQMWRNPGEIPNNGIDDDNNGYVDDVVGIDAIYSTGNPFDTFGHGTHVAGTIGAAANDGHPHVGIAWNVRLMACRFIGPIGGYTSDAIESINYAVQNGARILNASWGSSQYSHSLYDTVAAARDAGVLFVAAAGNSGADSARVPQYPSGYDLQNVISVAAIDRTGALASFSTYGQNVHLGAPGVEIFSSYSGSDTDYRYLRGTSMAAPHVCGVAALLWSQFPNLTVGEVRRRLLVGTTPTSSLFGKTTTGGRLDAYRALTIAEDGFLEVTVAPLGETRLLAGTTRTFVVTVSDLRSITNATVTGNAVGADDVTFRNDGTTPDIQAGDDVYSGSLVVPADRTNLILNLLVVAPGFPPTNVSANFPILTRPSNDDFADRIFLTGSSNRISGNNQLATREADEPYHTGAFGKHSMWWSWTATGNGYAQLNYVSSTLQDRQIAIYTGTGLGLLTPIAGQNAHTYDVLRFPVHAGDAYQIAVDGYRDSVGDFAFDLVYTNAPLPGPANDAFILRQPLVGLDTTQFGTNNNATREPLEPLHPGWGNHSVWWTWTAPTNCRATVDAAGTSFGIVAKIFLGEVLYELTSVGEAQSSTNMGMPHLPFNAATGRAYQILVDSQTNRTGPITISVSTIPQSRPTNDDFTARTWLSSLPLSVSGTLAGATWEHREPRLTEGQGSVWYQWQAAADGAVLASIEGAGTNAIFAVYSGEALGTLTRVDFEMGPGRLGWRASAGARYSIVVSSVGAAEPSFTLAMEAATSPVLLANPADRTVLATRTLRLIAETAGSAPLYHQWFRDEIPLSGQTNATLLISPATSELAGNYALQVSNPLGVATSAVVRVQVQPFAPTVGVFADFHVVQISPDSFNYGEPNYVLAAIERVGYPVSFITNLEHISVSALVIPNQRDASLANSLTPKARTAMIEFVRDGGLLFVTGSFFQRDAELLDSLFGFDLAGGDSSSISQFYYRTLQAEGTPFDDVPDPIESLAHTSLGTASLPVDALSLFQREDRSLAALMRHGEGAIVFLGPLFLSVRPLGPIDGGWLALIEAALRVSAPPLNRAPMMDSSPGTRFLSAGTSATLTATAYGSPSLSYQWYRGEEALPLATNSTLALNDVSAGVNGFYYVVVTNPFGAVTSDVARVVVVSTNQHVTVFDHPDFVRTLGGSTNESDALQASIRYLGYGVETATNFTSLPNGLVIIPSLVNGDLGSALSPSEAAALSNHVASGGALLLHGDPFTREAQLLNRLFGWQFESWQAESFVYSYQEPLRRRTLFYYCPAIIFSLPHSYSFERDTLPAGSVVAYLDDNDRAIVAELPWGRGKVIHLGWDWYNAAPLGSYDAGWMTVLGAALTEASLPEPRPHLTLTSFLDAPRQLILLGTPYAEAELQISTNLISWTALSTNIIPASGVLRLPASSISFSTFFRAQER